MWCRSSARASALSFVVVASLFGAAEHQAFAQAAGANPDPPQAPPPISSPVTPQHTSGFLGEPGFLATAITLANDRFGDHAGQPKSGFYPELSNMITGSGWVSLGPGYRQYFADDHAFIDTSAALSWRLYKMGQVRVELPRLAGDHLAIGTQAMWQDNTQVNYFGVGPDVVEDARSQYRMQTHDVVGYARATAREWLTLTGKLGWLGHPKLMDPGGTFVRDFPTTREAFPDDPAANLSVQPAFLHSEASAAADTRDHRGHPTSGFLYRGALINYWDRTYDAFTFHTWEAEGVQYAPLADARIVLAFHGWTVGGHTSGTNVIPFYMMPSIGGSRTLRAYHDFEFHDNNLLVAGAESRFAVWQHLDAALFMDAGNVAPRFNDLNLDKTSYGVGLRLHNDSTTLARLDVAHGAPGWHVTFSTSEPFRLPRVKRTIATVPFTP
ncbi:MAG TPA: BamA/TamA family outer membrane protein [Vicinamibacterales bacterium]